MASDREGSKAVASVNCKRTDSPPCDALVDDPVGVLADPDRWPNHVCDAVARDTTLQWARKQIENLGTSPVPDQVNDWAHTNPLPVGRMSMPGFYDNYDPKFSHREFGQLAALRMGSARLVLEPNIPFVQVTAFAIVNDHPVVKLETDGKLDWKPATMQFGTAGWLDPRVTEFQTWAKKWWDGRNAFGRPHGGNFTRQDAIEACLAYHQDRGSYPNQLQLAINLGSSERSLRSITGSWKQFLIDAEAWRSYIADFRSRHSAHDQIRDRKAKRQTTPTN